MQSEIRVGLLGCGVVGQGVLRLLENSDRDIHGRLGRPVRVRRAFLREGSPAREHVDPAIVTSDPAEVYAADDIDIVCELIGGVERAGELVEAALSARKPVVTANKALMAERGHELIARARDEGVDLYYEAAVGGGIPVIRTLREALASDSVSRIAGILNGTSNYMLSQMTSQGLDFEQALSQAQQAGYAEADPTLDVGGGDAAHKLALLTTLAFGARVQTSAITTEGITDVGAIDIRFAERFGFIFKPLAIAESQPDGTLQLRVHPALVPASSLIAHVTDALNTVHIESAALGPCILTGPGAGAGPTAVSVVSDVVDVGRNLIAGTAGRVPQRAFHEESLRDATVQDMGEHRGAYYMRFRVADKPGVLAEIAGLLGQHAVSIAHMIQDAEATGPDKGVDIVLLTHDQSREADVNAALVQIEALEHVIAPPRRFRIEEG